MLLEHAEMRAALIRATERNGDFTMPVADARAAVRSAQGYRELLAILNAAVWAWYREGGGDPEKPLFTLRKWFVRFTVRVKHLETILAYVFGPERSAK